MGGEGLGSCCSLLNCVRLGGSLQVLPWNVNGVSKSEDLDSVTQAFNWFTMSHAKILLKASRQ